ncbi:cyclic phosphodiesterase-like [Ananas comosus]|uniref:Cyclic phosphodiesterase-like n=1 Tax=Ananas comosus TaxID=4615 RepID=A0A6P5G9Q9_ANACO|nr:cyclic phosphodiesterase-like [Ananas comosus]
MFVRELIPTHYRSFSSSSHLPLLLRPRQPRLPSSSLHLPPPRSSPSPLMATQPTAAAGEVYSVWALPPEDVRGRLKRLMATLRSEFGGPAFDPHITVVGATRLHPAAAVEMLRSAAAALSPDPSPEVVEASAHCCRHFGYQSSTPYMPHLSLLYGDLTDEEKERARRRVEELDKEIRGLSFQISELALYKTDTEDKSLESWEKVEVCHLENK